MSLSFPRKFSDGYRVDKADCYADVYVYPNGQWLIGTHLSMVGGFHMGGTCVNISFILCDRNGVPLQAPGRDGIARFGMPADHKWCVAPSQVLGPADRHDSISGELPSALLASVESVSIIFIEQEKPPDWNTLLQTAKDLAKAGSELLGTGDRPLDPGGMYLGRGVN